MIFVVVVCLLGVIVFFVENVFDTNRVFKLKDETSSYRLDDGRRTTFFSLFDVARVSMCLLVDLCLITYTSTKQKKLKRYLKSGYIF